MTLTEFLLARIAEDEAACMASNDEGEWIGGRLVMLHASLLAECRVKRQIISNIVRDDAEWQQPDEGGPWVPHAMLRLIAIVYADHPDYFEACKSTTTAK